jgi:hypothetical protein
MPQGNVIDLELSKATRLLNEWKEKRIERKKEEKEDKETENKEIIFDGLFNGIIFNIDTIYHRMVGWIYCHALSDRRRVLDWQLDLLQSYTQVQCNWVSPDSLSLTIHDWVYHNNSAAIVTAATLVTGQLQVPFLPWIPTHSTANSKTPTTPWIPTLSTQLNYSLSSNSKTHNWELRGIWPLDGL